MTEFSHPNAPSEAPGSVAATVLLLGVISLVFLAEVMASAASGGTPWDLDVQLLTRLGGSSRDLVVREGQWWRVLTAPLLHGGALHVGLNALALWIIGPRLERLVGSAWFLAIFASSCLVGDLFSLAINWRSIVSIGASGGIMGLFATALIVSFGLEPGSSLRTELQSDAARVLAPALIPALFIPLMGGTQDGVDVAAHLGGALGGLAPGLFLMQRTKGRRS
jgi:rhomboid protease GluP